MTRLRWDMLRFFKSEKGSSTIEFVIWFTGIFFMLMLGYDLSMIATYRANFHDVLRQAAREYSVGHLTEAEIRARIEAVWPSAGGTVYQVDFRENGSFVYVAIETPIQNIASFSGAFTGGSTMVVRSVMPIESAL